LRVLEDGGDGPDDGDFKPIENPGDPERDHHQHVETTPRQPVETSGNISRNGAGLCARARGQGRRVLSGRGHANSCLVWSCNLEQPAPVPGDWKFAARTTPGTLAHFASY